MIHSMYSNEVLSYSLINSNYGLHALKSIGLCPFPLSPSQMVSLYREESPRGSQSYLFRSVVVGRTLWVPPGWSTNQPIRTRNVNT
jgi:hypothetical protein